MEQTDLVEQFHKAERLAEDILTFSRNILMVNLRFMDVALTQLRFRAGNRVGIATDGTVLEYGMRDILLQFKAEQEAVTRNFLHVVLHCVFRHMYVHTLVDKPRWDLACDITVENIINELGLEDTRASRQREQTELIETLKTELDGLTAEKLYRYYLDAGLSDAAVTEIRQMFYADDHSVWYLDSEGADDGTEEGYSSEGGLSDGGGDASQHRDAATGDDSETKGNPRDDQSADGAGGGDHNQSRDSGSGADSGGNEQSEGTADGGGSEGEQGEKEEHKGPSPDGERREEPPQEETNDSSGTAEKENETEEPEDSGDSDDDRTDENVPLDCDMKQTPRHRADDEGTGEASASERQWKDLSETIQQDLENFSKRSGSRAGSMLQNLRAVNRERYDYEEFLKKFASLTEVMQINEDEFDYIFYTYGLQMFRRIPLVEPLEYRDAKRIRDFVIAIDTSGSVSGELVQTFIHKTYNILKSTESFSSKINLHILQCDAQIQSDIKITDNQELEVYLKTMKITGLGGTDFRPVFAHVDELVAKGEFTKLCGLLYFTDGYGAFPEKMPSYRTAFILIDDHDNNPVTPSWAIRLVLHQDEL